MPGQRRNLSTRRWSWVAIGIFCCALITLSGIVQVGHTHADGQTVQSDCALCHTAHLVIQPTVPQSLPRTILVVASISAALQPIRAPRFSVFSLFTRPPPVAAAHL
jgi:hypothetical protein